ncbi:MAG: phosphoglycerate kinase [Candidatus Eiseniibacteriota bacterium]
MTELGAGRRKQGLSDFDPAGRRVLVRVDFNVPIRGGQIGDESRVVAALPTIRYLLQKRARVILMSHLGRPKGGPDPGASLKPVAVRLGRLLRMPIAFASDCVGPEAERMARELGDGQVLMLENLRFHPEEEQNDAAFAARLAALGEAYVNDAFGTAHRAHASTAGVPAVLHPAVAGFLMQKEIQYLGRALDQPARPFVAILGGAKISGKIDVITALLGKVDRLLIGGAMMFTFLRAQGLATGRSLVEDDRVAMARDVLAEAGRRKVVFLLPVDCLVSGSSDGSEAARVTACNAIGAGEIGVDIGPATIRAFSAQLQDARTILWNGPMGIFEVAAFANGTIEVARAVAAAGGRGAVTVAGGGDSAAAIEQAGLTEQFTHVSTGGGASLEFLEGKVMPGIAALDDREPS